jgi:hypothetical protein
LHGAILGGNSHPRFGSIAANVQARLDAELRFVDVNVAEWNRNVESSGEG